MSHQPLVSDQQRIDSNYQNSTYYNNQFNGAPYQPYQVSNPQFPVSQNYSLPPTDNQFQKGIAPVDSNSLLDV